MFNFNDLIGLEVQIAKEKLEQSGIKNVRVVENAEHNDKCDTSIVCAVRENLDGVTLICGEFLVNLKG